MTAQHESRDVFLSLDDRALLAECAVDTYRASGPGGQKRNKTDSAVRLRHRPTGLAANAVESRSQHENRARALRRLRLTIALNLREPVDTDRSGPGRVLNEVLLPGRGLHVSRRAARYTFVVAEILDLLESCGCGVSTTADRLGISTGQLVSFLKRDPALWARVGWMRSQQGLKTLR